MVDPQNDWFTIENPIKIYDLGLSGVESPPNT
jgi:hypothetical protein